MGYSTVFFDLDGTLTDSGEGIINCAQLALEHFGISVPSRETLRVFVGPPLRDSFIRFGVPSDQVEEAVRVFRSRYLTVGKFENVPYPGVEQMLARLQNAGIRLFVATSKPESTACEILEKFGLSRYFEKICGATMDGSRDSKSAVISWLLEKAGEVSRPVMVGDTAFDVQGAASHAIEAIGVSWGYGDVRQMEDAGAIAIVNSPEELAALLL